MKKMADSRCALSNYNIVGKLVEHAKNKNMLNVTQTWLNVWQTGATERKTNEQYEHEQLEEEEFAYELARAFRV